MTREQIKAVATVSKAILEIIQETGGGPEGHLYAAVMGDISLDQFNQLMRPLYHAQALTVSNHFVKPGPKLDSTMAKLNDILERVVH